MTMTNTTENVLRVSLRTAPLFLVLEDGAQLKFSGVWGSMFHYVLLRMRNSGLDLTVTEGPEDYTEHISDMENNKTDFTISFIPQQLKNSPLVEWGGATFFDDVHILSGGPTGASYEPFLILKTFQTKVWLCIMGYVIVASFLMGLSRYIYRSLPARTSVTNEILNSTLIVFGLLFNQGTEWTPFVVSQRILLSTCIFASTTISFMATCNLFSFLSSADRPNYIDNLDDLTSRPKIHIYQHHYLLASRLFKNSPRATERAAFEQAVKNEGIIESFGEIDIILWEILEGKAVFNNRISEFHNFIPVMFDMLEEDLMRKSFVHISEEPMMTEWWGLACRKALSKPVKEQFYQSTIRYTEGGTFYRDTNIKKDYTYYLLQAGHEKNIAPKQGMAIDNVYLPLVILATGILLALTQWRWPKWEKKRQRQSLKQDFSYLRTINTNININLLGTTQF